MTSLMTPTATHADIADCARRLHCVAEASGSANAVLVEATHAAVRLISPMSHAGAAVITDTRRRRFDTVAATSRTPTLHGALETSLRVGPCTETLQRRATTVVHDLATDDRWPTLRHALSGATSAHSCLVVPAIAGNGDLIGALTLFADRPDVIRPDDIALAESLADHAAFAVAVANRATQFDAALRSRDVIGQAKGMIMERYSIDAEAAFGLLTKLSQNSNVRVVTIATRLVNAEHPAV